jgi:hypothetical protein
MEAMVTMAMTTTDLIWDMGDRNGTSRVGFLDLPADVASTAIAKLEAAAGVTGDWDYDDDSGWNWWGLVGTFKGATFTVYTHKSGTLKIGASSPTALDLVGLTDALRALVT